MVWMGSVRWTTNLVCIGLLGATAAACGSRGAERALLEKRVPVARLDSVLKAADSVRLPLAAARSLLGVVAESGLAARTPHDTMTVGEILNRPARNRSTRQRQRPSARARTASNSCSRPSSPSPS